MATVRVVEEAKAGALIERASVSVKLNYPDRRHCQLIFKDAENDPIYRVTLDMTESAALKKGLPGTAGYGEVKYG